MFKNLAKAWNSFVNGIYKPELMAMNPKEWDWYQNSIRKPDRDLSKEFGMTVYKNTLPLPKYISYKYTLGIFSKQIPLGEVWMWRLEPNIVLRKFDLHTGNNLVSVTWKVRPESDFINFDVISGERLKEI